MFALFAQDLFKDFWGNQIGDIFVSATCNSLNLAPSTVDVVYYHGLEDAPEHFTFSPDKTLIIQRKVVSTEMQTIIDAETGESTERSVETVTYVTSRTIQPDPFFTKGVTIQPC